MRLVASRRDRDGGQKGIDGSEDVNTIGDQNVALSLAWRITDNIEWNARYNDRRSDRIINQSVLVEEGTSLNRNLRCEPGDATCVFGNNQNYALGLIAPPAGYTGPTLGLRQRHRSHLSPSGCGQCGHQPAERGIRSERGRL